MHLNTGKEYFPRPSDDDERSGNGT